MDINERDKLTRRNDDSLPAVAARFRAARSVTRLKQKDAALAAGVGGTAWNNAEAGRNYPSIQAMRWLFRAHRVDFNFLMAGEVSQLPADVQDSLLAELVLDGKSNAQDQKSS
jgi:transcriptional regulator with XRE-family HTH domain